MTQPGQPVGDRWGLTLADALSDLPPAFTWTPVNLEHGRTSRFYWTGGGRSVVPPAARSRVDRYEEYLRLYRGDYAPLGLDVPYSAVRANEFARVVDSYVALMMAFPPVVNGLADGFDIDSLMSALSEVIADVLRYGVGLLYSGDLRVQRFDPRYWFLEDNYPVHSAAYVQTSDVLLDDGSTPQRNAVAVTVFEGGIETTLVGEAETGYLPQEMMPLEPVQRGEFPVQVLAIPPLSDGYWGMSIYELMAPIVAELTVRASGASNVLRLFERPKITLEPVRQDASMPTMAQGDEQDAQLEVLRSDAVEGWQQDVLVAPPGYKVGVLTWDSAMASSFTQREMLRDELSVLSRQPAGLFGLTRKSGVPLSGAAIRATYASTYAFIEYIRTLLVAKIAAAVALAGGGDDVVVEWPNPLDQLAGQAPQEQVDEASGDEALSEGESDEDEQERSADATVEDESDG